MRKYLGAALLAIGLCLVAACSAPSVPANVPSNVAAIQRSTIGKVLKTYGYIPVYVLGNNAYIYVANCPEQNGSVDLGTCSSSIYNEGSLTRPNLYVNDGKIVYMQGPHDGSTDDRSYWSTVPVSFQNFAGLTLLHQGLLLNTVIPAIKKALGQPDDSGYRSLYVANVGQIYAEVSRTMP
jgi:hypothetical protein